MVYLPTKLEKVLFDDLGAQYHPDFQLVMYNLSADEETVKRYLGTYFPRSFIEAYYTFYDLLTEITLFTIFKNKSTISILDIGSGTGAYALGTVWAIGQKYDLNSKDVFIISVDGNGLALDYQKIIFDQIFQNQRVLLDTHQRTINPDKYIDTLKDICQNAFGKYDIIMISKFICEFFNDSYDGSTQGFYRDTLTLLSELLREDGLLVLNEVTNSIRADRNLEPFRRTQIFIPEILNHETYLYTQDQPDALRCIVPLSCAFFQKECKSFTECFQQKFFEISHIRNTSDRTIITEKKGVIYKIFAHKQNAEQILSRIQRSPCFKIAETTFGGNKYCINGQCVTHLESTNQPCFDAFSITGRIF